MIHPFLLTSFVKTYKANTVLIALVRQGYTLCISSITEYEIYTGATLGQMEFWNTFLEKTEVVPFDKSVAKVAVGLNRDLKRKHKLIDIADLFIAATAIANDFPFSTLNRKHFDRIDELVIIE